METFEFPKIHSFPPLYTKQPNATVLQQQLDSWCSIILSYCEYYKVSTISTTGTIVYSQFEELKIDTLPPIFENKQINRAVDDEFKSDIIKHLIHKLNKAEYINTKIPDQGILVYWKSLADWATILYDFVENSGQLGTVLTIYELTKSEDSGLPESLKNLDYNLLVKVLKNILIKQGKAQILMQEGTDQIGGVKIV
ncbi:vacuolar protein-sorting-associated protein 25 [[Candida] jaroonii]|uniref:Vacuolar protein-sorting-associated protein 25 n=1 Tax=[Candida] jaroonii TaxID=467808 RepID=A0ACA9Y051_9ASCO|nr:vacuolar protein-sorting-associated protein 25 [[Candida] jaroonii]